MGSGGWCALNKAASSEDNVWVVVGGVIVVMLVVCGGLREANCRSNVKSVKSTIIYYFHIAQFRTNFPLSFFIMHFLYIYCTVN